MHMTQTFNHHKNSILCAEWLSLGFGRTPYKEQSWLISLYKFCLHFPDFGPTRYGIACVTDKTNKPT